ncbi:Uncharacterized protein FWK35_00004120 [Aphis craccivora]|uniref:Uncharacterized protein n=1 Tax=Aphis craccivora TaxID=307492 RepID=A0A6G0YUS0_APHCR|nr:Uncharacterized protein FWK35_00004120 [Aphis craccivora]
MRKHYRDRIKLMYTDTDSLIYHVHTEDFNADLQVGRRPRGYFSDKVDGNVINKFCALRAKSCAFKVYAGEENEVKGKEDKVGGEKIKRRVQSSCGDDPKDDWPELDEEGQNWNGEG